MSGECADRPLASPQNDMLKALGSVKPSVDSSDLERQIKFTEDFGQEG